MYQRISLRQVVMELFELFHTGFLRVGAGDSGNLHHALKMLDE
jgi:hypothetical protein